MKHHAQKSSCLPHWGFLGSLNTESTTVFVVSFDLLPKILHMIWKYGLRVKQCFVTAYFSLVQFHKWNNMNILNINLCARIMISRGEKKMTEGERVCIHGICLPLGLVEALLCTKNHTKHTWKKRHVHRHENENWFKLQWFSRWISSETIKIAWLELTPSHTDDVVSLYTQQKGPREWEILV